MGGSIYEFEDVRSFTAPKNIPPVWVEMAGISYCNRYYRIDRVRSDVTVMEYVLSGTGTLTYNGTTYHPSAGDVYILQENSNHSYIADKNDPWVKIFVNLKGSAVPMLMQAFGLHKQVIYHSREAMHPIFSEIFEETQKDVPEEKIMERCSMLLMKLLCRMGQPGSYDEQTSDEARRMKNFIDSNYQRVLTMEDIAESIFRSKDYANKLFKRCYDITPYAYYLEVKMSNAKALLLHTSLSITQIAERLGYKNAEYFSKQFSQMVGTPATRFRSGDWEHTVE